MELKKCIFQNLINTLNVAVFEQMESGQWKITGDVPKWIIEIREELKKGDNFEIEDLFPFLETFLPGLYEIKDDEEATLYSDLWTEQEAFGEERYLQAIGLRKQKSYWVMILSHESAMFHDQKFLQIAREKVLFTEQLAKTNLELERLINFKDQFISIVSHDLRSPVSSVVSVTNLMLADKEYTSQLSELYLDLMENMNKDMQLLLDYNEKLYHWSNLQLGKFNVELSDVNLNKLLKATKLRFFERSNEKNIKIELIESDGFSFKADESLFSQVLSNLVGNAIKFTPPNGTITISSSAEKNRIKILISDTGIGIDPELMERIFSGYVKQHTSGTNGEKGSGLGLGISKRILDAHGFSIKVSSKINEGTQFSIIIPPEKK